MSKKVFRLGEREVSAVAFYVEATTVSPGERLA